MEFNEIKENGLEKKTGKDQNTVVFIKRRGEEETLYGVEIKKCSCSMVCAASYAVSNVSTAVWRRFSVHCIFLQAIEVFLL